MAQRKPTTGAQKRPASKPVPGARTGPGARPPVRKPNKSIVNQKQTPWGLIATIAVIVLFIGGIVVAVVATHKDKKSTSAIGGKDVKSCSKMIGNLTPSYLNENVCAKAIPGVAFYKTSDHLHVTTPVTYPQTPPVGGNHSAYWADCAGAVYPEPIANENAVHMLEHGAIWITYNDKTIKPADLTKLQTLVNGQDHMALSPYPDLKSPISIQSWGYQLFVNSASDPSLQKFIDVLRYNPVTTPEYGAPCSQPTFLAHPSTFGHPLFQPAQ